MSRQHEANDAISRESDENGGIATPSLMDESGHDCRDPLIPETTQEDFGGEMLVSSSLI